MILPALQLPRTLFASGALAALAEELRALGVEHPLLVTDPGIVEAGLAARAVAAAGTIAAPVVFDGVTENPIFADVDHGAALYREERCDGVIAVGGGSVIDTAKLIALLANNPGPVADYAGVDDAKFGRGASLVVVPTTAGTGSEVSAAAGIHPDPRTPAVGLFSRYLVPAVAVLDPDLTSSMPPRLAAATGIDALSHCIEGYLSCRDVPFSKSIALDGIARVSRSIREAVAGDAHARSEMMLAAYAGGVAIGMGLGPAHAVAITCGDQGLHHGVLSGIGLVTTLDVVTAHNGEGGREVARALGLDPGASLSAAIADLMRELGLPATLAEVGYAARDIEPLARAAHRSHFNRSTRYHPSAAEYAAMISTSLASR